MTRIPHLRWVIAAMLFLAAILNYVDRQALSILAPTIQAELKLTEADYGRVVDLFLVAYTISLVLSGRLVDKLGTRASMALFVTWWSVSNMLTVMARSAASLGFFRFLLGLGEAGNWPSSTKAVAEWFAPKERALAIAFYTMGATLGATIAPILILTLTDRYHWQATFVVTGALGLLWVVPWLWLYRPPQQHPRITEHERSLLRSREGEVAADAAGAAAPQTERRRWASALSRREVWALMLARMLTDPLWFFYQFWFSKYLFSDLGVAQRELSVTWVIYLAADVGSIAGGIASGLLIRRGVATVNARMWIMLACALLMPLSAAVATTNSLPLTLSLGMVTVFAHLAWLANIGALVVDLIPRHLVATCFGVVAAGSAVGGILMNKAVVYLVGHHSYAHWFIVMAFLHPLAWALLWFVGLPRAHNGRSEQVIASLNTPIVANKETLDVSRTAC
ncbi:MAG: MFS transporter [Tepidisphaeraceae bacterium]